ncbi:MAG TPA: hypothetical protein VLB85_01925 [Acidimicrobiia bacterium]|nr:hypothetical protein [Acidimicrobiia bacterium]
MDTARIEGILNEARNAVDAGQGLGGTGFWKAVGEVKGHPELAEAFADRMADIDRTAFEDWALATVPIGTGTALAGLIAALGLGAVAGSYYLDQPWNWLLFGTGTAILLVPTHSLGHLMVGRALGMRFTHWFVGSANQPQPGVKVDYSTYLRAPARQRAWMHAAGALTTKTIPFLLVPAARAADLPDWVTWLLLAAGGVMIATDIAWSTKASDWKKFRREMKYAR